MNYIIFDLEWNQAADLKTKTENSLEFEIIEIGAVKLNEKRELIDKFHELIKPQVFHKMNQVTGELLHLELEQLGNCRTFVQVAADFIRWCGTERVFVPGELWTLWNCRKIWRTIIWRHCQKKRFGFMIYRSFLALHLKTASLGGH